MRSPERAWARASVQPHTRRRRPCTCGDHGLDRPRALPVAQLPDVEVALLAVEPVGPLPAEEDVAGGLHQALARRPPAGPGWRTGWRRRTARAPRPAPPWPAGTAGRRRRGRAAARSRRGCRRCRRRPPCAPRATKRKCSSRCRRSPARGSPVAAHQLVQLLQSSLALGRARSSSTGTISGGSRDDPRLAVDDVGQLVERLHAVLGAGLRDGPRSASLDRFFELACDAARSSSSTSRWAYQTSRLRIPANARMAVRYRRGRVEHDPLAALGVGEAVVPARDRPGSPPGA